MLGRSVVVALTASAVLGCAQTSDADLESGSRVIVMIDGEFDAGAIFGAGIVFGRDKNHLYIATANHVVRRGAAEARNIEIRFKDIPGQRAKGILSPNFDKDMDLAVLVADTAAGFDSCALRLDILGDSAKLLRGDAVYPVGAPNGVPWGTPVAPDRVAQVMDGQVVFQSSFITIGDSGGALLKESGELVSMITADAPPFGRSTAIERVCDRIRQWGYPLELRLANSPSPLLRAIQGGDENGMKAALAAKCTAVNEPLGGSMPLHEAARRGAAEMVRALLKAGAKVDPPDSEGATPLQVAALEGQAEVARALLESGADVQGGATEGKGSTPFELALHRKHIDTARVLARGGARFSLAAGKITQRAATEGDVDILRLLLELGVDLKRPDQSGNAALHYAAAAARPETAGFLLKAGADANLVNDLGRAPLHEAIYYASDTDRKPQEMNRAVAVVEALAAGGAKLDQRVLPRRLDTGSFGDEGMTPLSLAASHGEVAIVRALLGAGADVNGRGADGRTALHFAAEFHWGRNSASAPATQRDLLRLLIEKGADVNAADPKGNPPLCMALRGDPVLPRIEVAGILLKAGARSIPDWERSCRTGGREWAPDKQLQDLLQSHAR